jgi:hypothetical protein
MYGDRRVISSLFNKLMEEGGYSHIKKYSVALIRKRTIPTERPPHVSEVSTNFADKGRREVSATDPNGH